MCLGAAFTPGSHQAGRCAHWMGCGNFGLHLSMTQTKDFVSSGTASPSVRYVRVCLVISGCIKSPKWCVMVQECSMVSKSEERCIKAGLALALAIFAICDKIKTMMIIISHQLMFLEIVYCILYSYNINAALVVPTSLEFCTL